MKDKKVVYPLSSFMEVSSNHLYLSKRLNQFESVASDQNERKDLDTSTLLSTKTCQFSFDAGVTCYTSYNISLLGGIAVRIALIQSGYGLIHRLGRAISHPRTSRYM